MSELLILGEYNFLFIVGFEVRESDYLRQGQKVSMVSP